MRSGDTMDRHVTYEDLVELKQDIKTLERKFDEVIESIWELKVELQKYKGNARAEIGSVSNKTAIMWGVFGSTGLIIFGAAITTIVQKLFGAKP